MSRAPKPTRRYGKATLSFGLLNIPIDIYSMTDAKIGQVKRHQRNRATGNPVGYKNYDKVTGDDVEYGAIYKVFMVEEDREVELTDDEIVAVTAPENGNAIIEMFLPFNTAAMIEPEQTFQARPRSERGKYEPATVKAWTALVTAMQDQNAAALVKLALRDRARYFVLYPNGRFVRVFFDQQVREGLPMPDPASLSDDERKLANALVTSALSPAPVSLSDVAAERVADYAASKLASGAAPPVVAPEPSDGVVELLDALKASVDAKVAEREAEAV